MTPFRRFDEKVLVALTRQRGRLRVETVQIADNLLGSTGVERGE